MTHPVYGSEIAAQVVATLALGSRDAIRQRELATAIGAPNIRGVQNALDSLEKRGVLQIDERPTYKLYRLDRSSPYYPGMRQIAVADLPVADLLAQYSDDVMAAIVFGSVADGTARPDSDLDLLIIGTIDEATAEEALRPLSRQLERRVDVVVMDYFEYRRRAQENDAFLATALSRGLVVMGETPRVD